MSSFHVKRTKTVDLDILPEYNGLRSTAWHRPPSGLSVYETQTTHSPLTLQSIPSPLNYLTPPPHWHWYQDEYFHIQQGRYIFTLEGQTTTFSASDPQPIHIPARARHTFRADDTYEDGECVVQISTSVSPRAAQGDPEGRGASEKFFRNVHSYLDDCYGQGVSPRLPQMLLFLHSAEVSLALPGPGWIARPVSWVFGLVVGKWFGGYVLGYRDSYEEYWSEKRE